MKTFSILGLTVTLFLSGFTQEKQLSYNLKWLESSIKRLEKELSEKYGKDQLPRIQRGLKQVSDYWQSKDGDSEVFDNFIRKNFIEDQKTYDIMFTRFQDRLEKLSGHMDRIVLNFREQADLDLGPVLPFDELFAAYNPAAHISDDFFNNKLAFTILLNFPLSTLEERSTAGMTWTRRQWAETRLASQFIRRIPADISLEISRISSESDRYIADYNIWMHHLLDRNGQRLFPPKLRLLSHWNLRDELKAQYANGAAGLSRQHIIQQVMERIVDQTIPEIVIDNPSVDWNPYTNGVTLTGVNDSDSPRKLSPSDISNNPEPNTRYLMLLNNFLVNKSADPYWPTMPNYIDRRFDISREIPEERVKNIFAEVLSSPLFASVGELIKKRLGRDLEPFDIWYNGFRPRTKYSEEQLNKIVSKKYPNALAFEADIPRILLKLGFSKKRTKEISELITVDPARGSGHAWGAQMRGAKTHLRTRIGTDGMDYKGYNIAVHELGHNVEQVISLNNIDYTLLHGVPNTAFTEAMAFVFQARDLELLDLENPDALSEALKTINDFWATCEIAGVALVDIAVWHWMYNHPKATPAELRDATLSISKKIWNTYYAPVFKQKDVILLGIYSHMISYPLYLADYPLGHLIAYQIEEKMKKAGSIGDEFDRIARLGNIAPDLWMKQATGEKVGPEALLRATKSAFKEIEKE
jgi:hypothetical protein